MPCADLGDEGFLSVRRFNDRMPVTTGVLRNSKNRGARKLWKSHKVENSTTEFPTSLGKHFVFPTFPQLRRLLVRHSCLQEYGR